MASAVKAVDSSSDRAPVAASLQYEAASSVCCFEAVSFISLPV